MEICQCTGAPAKTAVGREVKDWSGGDFFDPNASISVPREFAQRQFLEVARELYHVTAVLRDKVLPHYAKIGPDSNENERAVSELREWFSRYQLGKPWVLRQVQETLTLWTVFPLVARLNEADPPWHPLFDIVKRRPRPADTVPFVFQFLCPTFEVTAEGVVNRHEPAGWNLELDRRKDFVADARAQFAKALKAYCDQQERSAESKGLVKVKHRRHREVSWGSKVTWAVQRRCGRMEFEEIAMKHQPYRDKVIDTSTVIKAVNEILNLIDGEGPEPEPTDSR